MTLFAAIPVKELARAKGRLETVLDREARARLTLRMMGHVLSVLREAGVELTCVASPDRSVLDTAEEAGAYPLLQESRGLNPALAETRKWALSRGAASLLVLPSDLPLLSVAAVEELLDGGKDSRLPPVKASPDESLTGTNALLLRPPDALPFMFGPGSFEAHLRVARERGLTVRVCKRPELAFDLDTGEDLERLLASESFHEVYGRDTDTVG